ncbi:MAG: hypothetical protein WCX27_01100 [Candidatus Paceibacterota bacterium]|jgi:hypothetical protein
MKRVIKSQIARVECRVEHRERMIFWILFGMFASLILYYGFLVNSTIMNAVHRQKMEKSITTLNSEVNTMESKYLNLKNSITMDLATSKGFIAIKRDNFAMVTPASTNLSMSLVSNNQ